MSYINEPCLFLNKSWTPTIVKPVASAITSVSKGNAFFLDPVDYTLYTFNGAVKNMPDWMTRDWDSRGNFAPQPMHVVWDENPADIVRAQNEYQSAIDANKDVTYESGRKMQVFDPKAKAMVVRMKTIQGVRFQCRLPEIAIYTRYNKLPKLDIKWNRENLEMRDENECQYCGKKVYGKDATIDHIVPKAQQGKNGWSNTVISCFPCNTRKRNRTPDEAGMVLRSVPVKPKLYPPTAKYSARMLKSWVKWVPTT